MADEPRDSGAHGDEHGDLSARVAFLQAALMREKQEKERERQEKERERQRADLLQVQVMQERQRADHLQEEADFAHAIIPLLTSMTSDKHRGDYFLGTSLIRTLNNLFTRTNTPYPTAWPAVAVQSLSPAGGGPDNETDEVTRPLYNLLLSVSDRNYLPVMLVSHERLLFTSHKPDMVILPKDLLEACGLDEPWVADNRNPLTYALVDTVIEAKLEAFKTNPLSILAAGIEAFGQILMRLLNARDGVGVIVDKKAVMFVWRRDPYSSVTQNDFRGEHVFVRTEPQMLFDDAKPNGIESLVGVLSSRMRTLDNEFLALCHGLRRIFGCRLLPLSRRLMSKTRSVVFLAMPRTSDSFYLKAYLRYEAHRYLSETRNIELLASKSIVGVAVQCDPTSFVRCKDYEITDNFSLQHVLWIQSGGEHTLSSYAKYHLHHMARYDHRYWEFVGAAICDVGQTLVDIHEKAGLFHSDIKPSNIVVDTTKKSTTRRTTLIDWELAVTSSEYIHGYTRSYAAQDILEAEKKKQLNLLPVRFRYDLESLLLTVMDLVYNHVQYGQARREIWSDSLFLVNLDHLNKRAMARDEERTWIAEFINQFVELLRDMKAADEQFGAAYDYRRVRTFFEHHRSAMGQNPRS